MWRVERLEKLEREADSSSPDQEGVPNVRIVSEGVILLNAPNLTDFSDPERIQVHVREEKNATHSAPEGWIALRRLDRRVLWVPCFECMSGEDGELAYRPPYFPNGLPIFDEDLYAELRALVPGFPALETIRPLGSRSALRLLQFEAPGRVLGRFPEPPHLRREAIVSSNVGDPTSAASSLEAAIEEAWAFDTPVTVVETEPTVFHLDLPGSPEWQPLALARFAFGISSRGGPFVIRGRTL